MSTVNADVSAGQVACDELETWLDAAFPPAKPAEVEESSELADGGAPMEDPE